MNFKIGDEVIIKEGRNYIYTKKGSIGTIFKIDKDNIYCKWKFLVNKPILSVTPDNFDIDIKDVELYKGILFDKDMKEFLK